MNEDFIEPCFCFDDANLIDKIRQKVIDLQNDSLLDEISFFLDGSLKYLENDLPQDIASELYSAIFTFFNQFTKELMPAFDEILKKSRTNSHYIYITSLLLSYLTHVDLNLNIPDYKSFISDVMNEICQQITNQSGKLLIFGHEIAPQFQNDFILNTALSSTLNETISPKIFNYIFYHYWEKKDKKFDSFLLDIIKSGLNTILPQTDSSNEEIFDFLFKKDDQIFLKMSIESFSVIKSAIIYIKYKSNVQIKGLDAHTILQFAAVIAFLLPFLSDFSPEIPPFQLFKFSNEIDMKLFKDSINLLKESNLNIIDNYVLPNWPLLTVTCFVNLKESLDFLGLLIQQLINNEYKGDKFILLNLYLETFNQVKPSFSNQLSNLFTFIFTNLNNGFYDCRKNFVCNSFDLNYVDMLLVQNQMIDLESEEEAIQKIYFFEKICFHQTSITIEDFKFPSHILKKAICKEFENKNIENFTLINHFLEVYSLGLFIEINKLPLNANIVEREEINMIDTELLFFILKNDDFFDQKTLLFNLFDIMMKDEDNLFCYLSYRVLYQNNSYDLNWYFNCFYDSEYHETFLKVTKELFNYFPSKNRLILRSNFKIENLKISEFYSSIISKIFESIKENPNCNYQAFLSLKNIANTVPVLFNSNIQQIFDSILPPFNNLYLLFENKRKNEKSILLAKTAYASLSFLLSSFQSSLVLDHFVKWLFTDIENFSNSQIYGFLYILRCLSSDIIFCSFIESDYKKYDIFNKVVGFLNRNITEGSNFEKHYKQNIFGFLERVFYGFIACTGDEICINEMLAEKENRFTYLYINIYSTLIKYKTFPITSIDEDINQFIKLADKNKRFWFTDRMRGNRNNITVEQFRDELPQCEECSIQLPSIPGPISIRMIKHLLMKADGYYQSLMCDDFIYTKEQSELYLKTFNELIELQKQAQENPQDKENRNVYDFNGIEYFTPIINQPEFIKTLIDSLYLINDDLTLVLIRMAKYPIISEKMIEYINLKIVESVNDPSYLLNLSRFLFHDNFSFNLFNSCVNNLINTILSPKYKNNHELLIKMAKYLVELDLKLPIRVTQLIMLLILMNSNESISLALKLCKNFNSNELNLVNDILVKIFDELLNGKYIELLNDILTYDPSIINMRKCESISLLTKEFENYYNNGNDQSFQNICVLLKALAPDKINSTSVSNVITSSTLIPSFIKDTGKEYWNIYEKNIKLINEKLNENPYLLDKELSFLLNYPEIVDFKVRSSYFRKKMKNRIDKKHELVFSVDFNNLLESSFQCFSIAQPDCLLFKLRINVVDSMVVDEGGVTRNWFTSLAKELFNQNYGIFNCSKSMGGYKPNCNSSIHPNHLEIFKFAGMFIARALIEGVNIDAHLTSSFCKQILHRKTCLKDIEDIDDEIYRSLKSMLENDANELYLTFSMNVDNLGEIKTIELKENGSEIPVTNENKVEFVNLRTNYILHEQIKDQLNAFQTGFDSLMPHEILRIFTPSELDLLICGVPSIDVNDFKENMTYIEPYNKDTLVVKLFFEVIQNWGNDDLAKLLLFMTGSSRVPLNGFKEFVEVTGENLKIGPGGKRENWPQSHTCFNELDLPEYQTKEELETNLRRAMEYYNTFGMA